MTIAITFDVSNPITLPAEMQKDLKAAAEVAIAQHKHFSST